MVKEGIIMKPTCVFLVSLAILLCVGCSSGPSDPDERDARQPTRAAAEPAPAPKTVVPAPKPAVPPALAPVAEPTALLPAAPTVPGDLAATGVVLVEREGISLASLVIARGVELRQPVEPGTTFSLAAGNKLYAVMDVKNPSKEPSELSVAWLPEGGDKERGAVTLSVGAQPKWKTWAYHSGFRKPGRWTAIVRDAAGEEIGRATFAVTD
jgi:hypothetical protein